MTDGSSKYGANAAFAATTFFRGGRGLPVTVLPATVGDTHVYIRHLGDPLFSFRDRPAALATVSEPNLIFPVPWRTVAQLVCGAVVLCSLTADFKSYYPRSLLVLMSWLSGKAVQAPGDMHHRQCIR